VAVAEETVPEKAPVPLVTPQRSVASKSPSTRTQSRRRPADRPLWQQPWVMVTAGAVAVVLLFVYLYSDGNESRPISDPKLNHETREVQQPGQREKLLELQPQQKEVDRRIIAVRARVREQIIKARKFIKTTAIELPQPLASWEFEGDFKDSIGSLDGNPMGGARLESGALVLDGKDDYVITVPITRKIMEKTLATLVQLDNLGQRGGAAISIQTPNRVVFDAIVYGEREAQRWMAGSDNLARTKSFHGMEEKEASGRPVHVAIVYRKDGTVTGYRDGQPYGKSYKTGSQPFPAGGSLLFGIRHMPPGGNRLLAGRLLEVQLFDRALDEEAVAALSEDRRNYVPEKEIVAFLKGEERAGYLKLKEQQARWLKKEK